jgi:DNA modification methylase
MRQLTLFDNNKRNFFYELGQKDWKPVKVSFRDIIPEIRTTTYLTHSIYYYPAKFIPQVVRFCIKEFTKPGDWIIDPFAGSGTVGLEAFLTGRNVILLELNYILKHIVPIKIYTEKEIPTQNQLLKKIECIKKEKQQFVPSYNNITYWYPKEVFEVLSKYWAGLHKLEEDVYKWIIQASLLKISKLFSFAEHRTPKLFKSKYKKEFIKKLMSKNWKIELDQKLLEYAYKIFVSVLDLCKIRKNNLPKVICHAGVDSSTFKLNFGKKIDVLITSPPYLQAQEYIRTSKLDLFWLGYTEDDIKKITKLEIPYRKHERIVETPTLNRIRAEISNNKLLNILNSYFDHVIASLENNMNLLRLNGKACIFVGNPKVDGVEVETWKILAEYFTKKGFKFEIVFDDEIKSRQLFGNRNNKNPNGMKSEFLLILSKNT